MTTNKKGELKIIVKWLKIIFSWKVASGIIVVAGFIIGYIQFKHDQGGEIAALLNGKEVNDGDKTDIVVFMGDEIADYQLLANLITPQ